MPEDIRGFYAATEWRDYNHRAYDELRRSDWRVQLEDEHKPQPGQFFSPKTPQEYLLETVEGMTPSQRSRLAAILNPAIIRPDTKRRDHSWILYLPDGDGRFVEPGPPTRSRSGQTYMEELKAIDPELRFKLMYGDWPAKPEPPKVKGEWVTVPVHSKGNAFDGFLKEQS